MPSFPSSGYLCSRVLLGLATLCATTPFLLHSQRVLAAGPQVEKIVDGTEQRIIIHADKNMGDVRLRHGFVHGLTYTRGQDYSKTVALISALKPMSWRSSNSGVYGFVVNEARLPQTIGTELVVVIQDVFNSRYGYEIKINPGCAANRKKNCFSSYDAFKKSWLEVVSAVMRSNAEKKLNADYFDVFAEPDYGTGTLGVTPEQLGDIFKSTHDTVRKYRPNAKIVAPSITEFRERFLTRFLTFVAENNLRLDAVSWHEFNAPEKVLAHVGQMRELFKAQPRLCDPKCPEIHINEYAPEDQLLVPGYGVGWLYYLEKSGVDHANRACWDRPDTCWYRFSGMLLKDNATPQPIYWAFRAYADMSKSRLSAESSRPQTVAIASKDEAKREFRILAGKYGQKGASGRVMIDVRNVRYNISSVIAEIRRIPDSGGAERALPAVPAAMREVVRVRDNSFSILIPEFRDGEAYSIVVRPGGGGNAH